jgi:hypothetical protein
MHLESKTAQITFNRCSICFSHRLSMNRPIKRGKKKSPSDGHCHCEKEIDDHLVPCQQILEREPRSDTPC